MELRLDMSFPVESSVDPFRLAVNPFSAIACPPPEPDLLCYRGLGQADSFPQHTQSPAHLGREPGPGGGSAHGVGIYSKYTILATLQRCKPILAPGLTNPLNALYLDDLARKRGVSKPYPGVV